MEDQRRELHAFLGKSRQEFVSLVKSLTPAELDLPTEDEGWTVKDIVAHAASSESGLIATIKRIVEGHTAPRPGFDLDAFNQHQVEKRRGQTVDESLAEQAASRPETLAMLDSLTDGQLALEGQMASGAPTTVIGVFRRIGDHETLHAEQIRRAIGRK